MKASWYYYGLLVLTAEKTIQHIVVTLAFYFNWGDIASTVRVSPGILMVLGALLVPLFAISFWGILKKRLSAINLVIFLALFDMVGEFVAQGKIGIRLTVSFLVAALLLLVGLMYRRQLHPL